MTKMSHQPRNSTRRSRRHSTRTRRSRASHNTTRATTSLRRASLSKLASTATAAVATASGPVDRVVDFTADVAQEIVNTLTTITSGVVSGANTVVGTAGSLTEQLGDSVKVYSTQVFNGAGDVIHTVSEKLGNVLRVIPKVGGTMAYVVESAVGGVYHVVVAVGDVGGSAVQRVGKVAKRSTDLVVYTLTAGDNQIQDTSKEVNGLVGRLAKGITGRATK